MLSIIHIFSAHYVPPYDKYRPHKPASHLANPEPFHNTSVIT